MFSNKSENNKHSGLQPEVIKALLIMKHKSLVSIARELNCDPSHITNLIERRSESYRGKKYIASCLGLAYEVVWGRKPRRKTT